MSVRLETVKRFTAAQREGRVDEAASLLADDVVMVVPRRGEISGKKAVVEVLKQAQSQGGRPNVQWSDPVERGETVEMSATTMMGRVVQRFSFRDEQICRVETGIQAANPACAACGAEVVVPEGADRIDCPSCGVSQTVQREGGTVVLQKAGDAPKAAATPEEKSAAQAAVRRLQTELEGIRWEQQTWTRKQIQPVSMKALWTGVGVFAALAAVFLIVISVQGGASPASGICLISYVVPAAVGIAVGVYLNKRERIAGRARIGEEMPKFQARIAEKERELLRQRAILNS